MNSSDFDSSSLRHLRTVYVSLFSVAILVLTYQVVVISRSTHLFMSVYEGMGSATPAVTRIYFSSYMMIYPLPLIAVIGLACSFWSKFIQSKWSIVAVVFCFSSGFFVYAWSNHALYAPIIKMNSTLGTE